MSDSTRRRGGAGKHQLRCAALPPEASAARRHAATRASNAAKASMHPRASERPARARSGVRNIHGSDFPIDGRAILRQRPARGQQRRQRERHEQRKRGGKNDHQSELAHERADDSAHESDRREDRDVDQRDRDRRAAEFATARQRRFVAGQPASATARRSLRRSRSNRRRGCRPSAKAP